MVEVRRASLRRLRHGAAAVAIVCCIAGCSSTSASEKAEQAELANELVSATAAAGVAPNLTPELAMDMYGTDAPAVCDVFEGGPGAAEAVLLGNPALGRRKAISDEAVTYARIVVQTYCPDVLDDFDDAVADIDPMEIDR